VVGGTLSVAAREIESPWDVAKTTITMIARSKRTAVPRVRANPELPISDVFGQTSGIFRVNLLIRKDEKAIGAVVHRSTLRM
jgi:hypothetical protein